jgi:hypothetical protein
MFKRNYRTLQVKKQNENHFVIEDTHDLVPEDNVYLNMDREEAEWLYYFLGVVLRTKK